MLSPQLKNTDSVFLLQLTWKERSPCQVQKKEESPLLAAGESGCHSNEPLPKSTHYMAFELDFLCVYTPEALSPPCLPPTCLPDFSPGKHHRRQPLTTSFKVRSYLPLGCIIFTCWLTLGRAQWVPRVKSPLSAVWGEAMKNTHLSSDLARCKCMQNH